MTTRHGPPETMSGNRGAIEFIARGMLIEAGHLLACRNLKHGYLYLPGGHVDFGESAAEACAREFLEETGLAVRVRDCRLVCEARFEQGGKPRHEITAVFLVEHSDPAGRHPPTAAGSPAPVPSLEPKIGFDWIARERLAEADLRPRVMRDWLIGRVESGPDDGTDRPDWISDPPPAPFSG